MLTGVESSDSTTHFHGLIATSYVGTAVLCLFLYDFLLTFSKEVETIWRSKIRPSTVLYFIMRYLPLAQVVLYGTVMPNVPDCARLSIIVNCLGLVARLGIAFSLVARTYAICAQSRVILVVFALLGISGTILDGSQFSTDLCANISPTKTYLLQLLDTSLRLVFEAAVIIISIIKTWGFLSLQSGLGAFQGRTVTGLLLSNGIMYFSTVFMLELMDILLPVVAPASLANVGAPLSLPIPAILMGRFILELRDITTASRQRSDMLTTIHFAPRAQSVIINEFGNNMLHLDDEDLDDMEGEKILNRHYDEESGMEKEWEAGSSFD